MRRILFGKRCRNPVRSGSSKRGTTTAFQVRALRWFRARGVNAERIMTDSGSAYVSRLFAKALR